MFDLRQVWFRTAHFGKFSPPCMNNNVFTSRMEGSFLQPDIDHFRIQPITGFCATKSTGCSWRGFCVNDECLWLPEWMPLHLLMCIYVCVCALWPSPFVESCVSLTVTVCMCSRVHVPRISPLQRPQEPPRSEREKEGERAFTVPNTGH